MREAGPGTIRYMRREAGKAALVRELGISRPTLDRLFAGFAGYAQQRERERG